MQFYYFNSPLEQFEIIPIISFKMGILDFSITNEVVVLSLIFFFVSYLFIFRNDHKKLINEKKSIK